jgi:hypothetical protein
MNQNLGHWLQPFFGKRKVGSHLLRIIRLHLRQIKKVGQGLQNVATFSQNRDWNLPGSHVVDPEVEMYLVSCAQAVVLIDEQMALSGCLAAIEKPFQIPPFLWGRPSLHQAVFLFFRDFSPKIACQAPESPKAMRFNNIRVAC